MVLGNEILGTVHVIHSAALTHVVSCTSMLTCPNSWVALGVKVLQTVDAVHSMHPDTCGQFHRNAGTAKPLGGVED